jgi:hypothetical protein
MLRFMSKMRDHTRREFLKYGTALVLGGATALAGNDYDEARDPTNTEITVNTPEGLGEVINRGRPTKAIYDLGKGEKRKELLVTLTDGNTKKTDRITSSLLFELCKTNGRTSMNITDSDGHSYRNLTPLGADFEEPDHPPYEIGSLAIDLGGGKQLGISPYYRAAA